MIKIKIICAFVFFFCGYFNSDIIAQNSNIDKYVYIAPLPGSEKVTPYTNIILTEGPQLDRTTIDRSEIIVIGSKSGIHKGKKLIVENSKTILFKPLTPFAENEKVSVELHSPLTPINGEEIIPLQFYFNTGNDNSNTYYDTKTDITDNNKKSESQDFNPRINIPVPIININNNPTDEYLLLGLLSADVGHLLIVDNLMNPVFYRKVTGIIFDFKWQLNRELTYTLYPSVSYGMDNSGIPTRQFSAPAGYGLDTHDLEVMEDGSYYVLGREILIIDMSQYVSGGDTEQQCLLQILFITWIMTTMKFGDGVLSITTIYSMLMNISI